jgi:mRNA interferase MazF
VEVKRGQIWFADLGEREGSEQRGVRPVLIIQNDVGNLHSPTVIAASITTAPKRYMPTHLLILKTMSGLRKNSLVLFEQIHTVDKSKLLEFAGILTEERMQEADDLIKLSLGLATLEEVKECSRKRYQSRAAR